MVDLPTDKCQIWIFDVYLNFTLFAPNLNLNDVYIDQLFMKEDNLFTSSDFHIRLPHDHYLVANSDIFHSQENRIYSLYLRISFSANFIGIQSWYIFVYYNHHIVSQEFSKNIIDGMTNYMSMNLKVVQF